VPTTVAVVIPNAMPRKKIEPRTPVSFLGEYSLKNYFQRNYRIYIGTTAQFNPTEKPKLNLPIEKATGVGIN
jgi:hypothetical protein